MRAASRRRSRRRLAAGGALLLLALVLFGLYAARGDDTLAEVRRRGVLRVGLDASFPPFEALNEQGEVVGLDADLARAIGADLGVRVEFVNIGFDGLYDALLARRVELVISGLPVDPRWTKDVAYSATYFNAGQALLVRGEGAGAGIAGAEDLAGQTVAVEWGSLADVEARRIGRTAPGLETLPQPTAREAVQAVLDGRAGAAIVDNVTARGALAAGDELRLVTMLSDDWYAAAVRIDSRELLAAVNRTLRRLEESGEMAALQERWFGP